MAGGVGVEGLAACLAAPLAAWAWRGWRGVVPALAVRFMRR